MSIPIPPCTCWVVAATRAPASAAQNFAMRAARSAVRPCAISQAACQVVHRIASASMNPSAIRCCTAWKLPIGRPNCSRPVVYSAAIRSARSETPTWIAHRPTRARVYSALTRSPGPSSRSATETIAPSRNTSACGSRLVVATGRTSTPWASVVSRNRPTSPSSVLAGINTVSASWPAGTSSLVPSSRQFAPSRRAVVAGWSGRSGRAPAGPRTGCGFRR